MLKFFQLLLSVLFYELYTSTSSVVIQASTTKSIMASCGQLMVYQNFTVLNQFRKTKLHVQLQNNVLYSVQQTASSWPSNELPMPWPRMTLPLGMATISFLLFISCHRLSLNWSARGLIIYFHRIIFPSVCPCPVKQFNLHHLSEIKLE